MTNLSHIILVSFFKEICPKQYKNTVRTQKAHYTQKQPTIIQKSVSANKSCHVTLFDITALKRTQPILSCTHHSSLCPDVKFYLIQIYLFSAFHNTHRFKAALQKINASSLQFKVICYQRWLSLSINIKL